MKAFIAAICLASAAAQAGTIFVYANKNGGEIRMTDETCEAEGQSLAYIRDADGAVHTGCYIFDTSDKQFVVKWWDGSVYAYPLSAARLTDYGTEKLEAARNATTQENL